VDVVIEADLISGTVVHKVVAKALKIANQ